MYTGIKILFQIMICNQLWRYKFILRDLSWEQGITVEVGTWPRLRPKFGSPSTRDKNSSSTLEEKRSFSKGKVKGVVYVYTERHRCVDLILGEKIKTLFKLYNSLQKEITETKSDCWNIKEQLSTCAIWLILLDITIPHPLPLVRW